MLLYSVRKSNKGFTLIEMIAVVIIVGIIAAIAAPNFLGLLNRNRVTQGLADVDGAIREAQRIATRNGKVCKIRFTTTGTGSNKRSVVQVHPDEVISGTNVSYAGCLLETRELEQDVTTNFLVSGTTLTPIDSSGLVLNLGFSGKGNPSNTGVMVISHSNSSSEKCIEIKGILGNIIAGNYDSATRTCTPD